LRRWTPNEVSRLENLIERNHSYTSVARRLKRSVSSVRNKAKERGCTPLRNGAFGAQQVQRLLGVKQYRTIDRWIRRGWIHARNVAATSGLTIWRIHEEDLMRFLENRAYWMAWEPDRITDPSLRHWAHELRDGQPRWLLQSEVAVRYHVSVYAVSWWLRRGQLQGYRVGNNRMIWESDLDGFVPPCMREKR
jgi:hypothetical protein